VAKYLHGLGDIFSSSSIVYIHSCML